jgi:hypothetical protein
MAMLRLAVGVLAFGLCVEGFAQAQGDAVTYSPEKLPGKGLAQHDFFYAGESHQRRMFVVRQGKIVWSYDDPAGKGEISDAVMLSNGNILFAHQFGVTLITPEKKVLWNYEPPAGHEVHTAVPIGTEHVLYIQNGDQGAAGGEYRYGCNGEGDHAGDEAAGERACSVSPCAADG